MPRFVDSSTSGLTGSVSLDTVTVKAIGSNSQATVSPVVETLTNPGGSPLSSTASGSVISIHGQ